MNLIGTLMNKCTRILLFTATLFSLKSNTGLDKPTDEQLYNTDKIEISLTCHRDIDKNRVNMDSWFKIAKATDELIDKCYAQDELIEQCYTDLEEKEAELFEEVCAAIRLIRKEQRASYAQGIGRSLYVAGQTTHIMQEVTIGDQTYIIVNALTGAQTEQLLQLCNKQWWAIDRTRENLDTLLENSLYFALIDASNQKVVGFIRAITDYVWFAGIHDVMVDAEYQGKGLGRLLVEKMLAHPKLSTISLIELECLKDKVGFYERFGFESDLGTIVPMRLKK